MVTGSYSGNAVDDRAIAGLPSTPRIVIIKNTTTNVAVMRTTSMIGDATKELTTKFGSPADRIQSLDTNGFTVGQNATVNASGSTYHWIAFEAPPNAVAIGTYLGNGVDDRAIPGIGFQPDYVVVMANAAEETVQRSSAMAGDLSFRFAGRVVRPTPSSSCRPTASRSGQEGGGHVSGNTYHYVAWKAVAKQMAVGSYVGDSTDNRNIGGLGFQPAYVLMKSTGATHGGVHKPSSTRPATDLTLEFSNGAAFTDGIQLLTSDGFQVGSGNLVNDAGKTYYWAAFGTARRIIVVD